MMPRGPVQDICECALLQRLASVRLTLVGLVLLGVGAWLVSSDWMSATWATGIPLVLLAINLIAAMVVNRRLRSDPPLVVLHLALLAVILLAGAERLTYFDGLVPLTRGETFTGQLVKSDAGPLHRWRPERLEFTNEGFTEWLPPSGRFVTTRNRVSWRTAEGVQGTAEIGDDSPLLMEGYRIFADDNRGYAAVFRWKNAEGGESLGSMQFPDPGFRLQSSQKVPLTASGAGLEPLTAAQDFSLPEGPEVWVLLETPEGEGQIEEAQQRANLGADQLEHSLLIRTGGQRFTLRPGESVELEGGRLTYEWLDTWMGYRIVAVPFIAPLFAAAAVALLSLIWLYLRQFRASSWQKN